jgi:hypothetical protein
MAKKRRRLNGKSVLIASGGAMLLGCGEDVGNPFLPEAPAELCVEAEPSTAEVLVDGDSLDVDGCTIVSDGFSTPDSVRVTATAEGYQPFEEIVLVNFEGRTNFTVVMTEEGQAD